MEFRNHPSQELSQQHFSDQNLGGNTSILRTLLPEQFGQSSPDGAGKDHKEIQRLVRQSAGDPAENHQQPPQTGARPTWLNRAILREQSRYGDGSDINFVELQRNSETTSSQQAPNQWLSSSVNVGNVNDSTIDADESADLSNTERDYRNFGRNQVGNNSGVGGELTEGDAGGSGIMNWQNARYKAEILGHPLYEQLLSAHVACLRVATPVDQLLRIDAQLDQSQHVVAKYSALSHANNIGGGGDKELDQFMTHYVLLLCSFKDQLQQHVCVHAMEAVMACWEIEQSLQSLTGVSPGEGTGATMSDDDDDQVDSDTNLFDGSLEGHDTMGFGSLVPTESERSLMERVRQELKHDLKQGYKEKIVDIREEILRKRRAGKLPGDTTSVLKAWWQTHAKWPYPTEEDKAKLVQETGLELKQINNWFINQRKRNWHSDASTSAVLKSKRKR